jgi:hypothetical protein
MVVYYLMTGVSFDRQKTTDKFSDHIVMIERCWMWVLVAGGVMLRW